MTRHDVDRLAAEIHFDPVYVAQVMAEFAGEEALAWELLRVAASMGRTELPPVWRRIFAPRRQV